MKVLKAYLQPITKSLLSALADFRHELLQYKLSQEELRKFLEEFAQAYKRSEDYDMAAMRVFRDLMPSISRKTSFKNTWKSLNITKQSKGDTVMFMNQKFKIEDMKPNYKDGQNLYTLCRLETIDGVDLKVVCYKVLAKEDELRAI